MKNLHRDSVLHARGGDFWIRMVTELQILHYMNSVLFCITVNDAPYFREVGEDRT